jgi:hypothetical protein
MITIDNAQTAFSKISEMFKTDLVQSEKDNLKIREITIQSITKIIKVYENDGKIRVEGKINPH